MVEYLQIYAVQDARLKSIATYVTRLHVCPLQRSALSLGGVGFATTTDVQRQLHPPDKQDVAARLLLELRRLALPENEPVHSIVSRGPELLSSALLSNGSIVLRMSNDSLSVSAGILTGCTVTPPFNSQS